MDTEKELQCAFIDTLFNKNPSIIKTEELSTIVNYMMTHNCDITEKIYDNKNALQLIIEDYIETDMDNRMNIITVLLKTKKFNLYETIIQITSQPEFQRDTVKNYFLIFISNLYKEKFIDTILQSSGKNKDEYTELVYFIYYLFEMDKIGRNPMFLISILNSELLDYDSKKGLIGFIKNKSTQALSEREINIISIFEIKHDSDINSISSTYKKLAKEYLNNPKQFMKKYDDPEIINRVKNMTNSVCSNLSFEDKPFVIIKEGKYLYCFTEKEVYDILKHETKINPFTGKNISKENINIMISKFPIELIDKEIYQETLELISQETLEFIKYWQDEVTTLGNVYVKVSNKVKNELSRFIKQEPITLYRGLSFENYESFNKFFKQCFVKNDAHNYEEAYEFNCNLTFDTYSSWSYNISVAKGFAIFFEDKGISVLLSRTFTPDEILMDYTTLKKIHSSTYDIEEEVVILPGIYNCNVRSFIEKKDIDLLYGIENIYTTDEEGNKIVIGVDFSNANLYNVNHLSLVDKNIDTLKYLGYIYYDDLRTLDISQNIISNIDDFDVKNIIELDLSYNKLLKSIDNFNVRNLVVLNLKSCGIKSIDNFDVKNLETLNLNSNNITSVDNFDAKNLFDLDLSSNKITSIDKFDVKNLEYLILYSNNIISVDNFDVKNIKALDLSSNNIISVDNFDVKNIEALGLRDNKINSLDNFDVKNIKSLNGKNIASYIVSGKLNNNRKIILAEIKEDGLALRKASDELKNDRELVLTAVKQDGFALKYASYDLKINKEIVLAAVKQDGEALEFTSDELKNDRDVVLAAVNQDGFALEFASKELRNDPMIVYAAIMQNGLALKFASGRLINFNSHVFIAVKQNGLALQFASEKLRNDKEIVLLAVKQNGLALQFASDELRGDKDVVVTAVNQNITASKFASNDVNFLF